MADMPSSIPGIGGQWSRGDDDAPDPRVIGVDDDDADAVLAALSSDTARAILSTLHDSPGPASDVADRVDTSLQNTQYHLKRLREAGVVEVVDTVYSQKGREMDVYAPADGPLVLVAGPESQASGIRATLSRLLGGVGAVGLGAVVVETVLDGPFAPSIGFGASGGAAGRPEPDRRCERAVEHGLDDDGAEPDRADAAEQSAERRADAGRLRLRPGHEHQRAVGGSVHVHLAALLGVDGVDHLDDARLAQALQVVLGVLQRGVDAVGHVAGGAGAVVEGREDRAGGVRGERREDGVGVVVVDADDPRVGGVVVAAGPLPADPRNGGGHIGHSSSLFRGGVGKPSVRRHPGSFLTKDPADPDTH